MNIKKLLILASITLQFSTIVHAFSQDAYNTAFHAFDVRFNSPAANTNTYKQSAAFIAQHGNNYSRSDCAKVANSPSLNTPEAKAVGFFLADGQISSKASSFTGADGLSSRGMSYANLQTAIAAAPDSLPAQQSSGGGGSNPPLSEAPYNYENWKGAFGGTSTPLANAQAVYNKTASKTLPTGNSPVAKNAQVVLQYLNSTKAIGDFSDVLNDGDRANLKQALTTAGVSLSSVGQLSDATYSAPVWARTLASFGGGQAVYDKAAQVPKNLNPNLSNENFYNNAKVLVQYFSKPAAGDFSGVLNPTDLEYLKRAFSEAGVTMGSGSNPADGQAATVAANLKAQIESSKVLYNQYLQSLGQAPLYVAQ